MEKRKEQIRKEYRIKRDLLTEAETRQWSKEINKHLIHSRFFQEADAICFYYPLDREADLLESASRALTQGKQVFFPKTQSSMINFYQVRNLTDFKIGCFRVMEPESNILLDIKEPLILTPGVAFDRNKNRMGYGKGYYDRYAAGLPGAVKVGIAYECQLAETIPADSNDIPMDYMITEAGIW